MTYIQLPNSFYTPYLKEQYSWANYCYESSSISPNNKYLVVKLINNSSHNKQLDLFEISDSSDDLCSEPCIKFCNTILVLNPKHNNGSSDFDDIHLGYIWSSSGYKLICEYQERETADASENEYMIVYFDMYNYENKQSYINPIPLFADNKYIWEHNMHFSADDNILVTVYNSEIIRVFEFDPINKNYVFRTELSIAPEKITTIYLTPDNKIIASIDKLMHDRYYSFIAYKLLDDLTGIIQLTLCTLSTSAHIFNYTVMTHNNTEYLLYYLSNGVDRNTRFIYLYNVTRSLIKVIDLHDCNVSIYSYACNNYMIVRNNTTRKLEQFDLISMQSSSIPLTQSGVTSVALNFMYTCENSLDNSSNFIDAKFKIYRSPWDYNSTQPVYQLFDSMEYSKYRHKRLEYLHNTENYIIYQIRNGQNYKLCIGNSLQLCYDKNIDIVTQLLSDYIPVELCYKVAEYIK